MKNQNDNLLLELITQAIVKIGDKVDQKADDLTKELTEIKVTLERNTISLEEHMLRTELLEQKLEQDLKPVKSFYDGLVFIGKVLALLALISGIISVCFEAYKILLKL